jgi:hypothetical protein
MGGEDSVGEMEAMWARWFVEWFERGKGVAMRRAAVLTTVLLLIGAVMSPVAATHGGRTMLSGMSNKMGDTPSVGTVLAMLGLGLGAR